MPGKKVTQIIRVLLVEDYPPTAIAIRAVLERSDEAKFEIDVADRLATALPRLSSAHIVLLDLHLPDSEGIETIRRVRAAAAIPIIVLTAQEQGEIGKASLHAGANDFFMKGTIESRVLARAILRACSSGCR